LTKSGEVYEWGNNDYRIGENCDVHQFEPIKLDEFNGEKIIMISRGCGHSLALTERGTVYYWGSNKYGQMGFEEVNYPRSPRHLELGDTIVCKISGGQFHNLLLTDDGVIYAFGDNKFGQLGNGDNKNQTQPTKIEHGKKFKDIATHNFESLSMALSFDNIYYVWGNCGEEILIPIETNFNSFNEAFTHYMDYNLSISEEIIEFINHKVVDTSVKLPQGTNEKDRRHIEQLIKTININVTGVNGDRNVIKGHLEVTGVKVVPPPPPQKSQLYWSK
jgi:alpha-tubulin suppressor-like RCC1 family protein